MFYTASVQSAELNLYSINTSTGLATKVGDSGFTITEGGGVAVSPDGTVFATPTFHRFGTYDKMTGKFTNITD